MNFSGVNAHIDAKGSFSQQLKTLKNNFEGEKISKEVAYTDASRMMIELEPYDTWESSWRPVALGGWYSLSEIKNTLQEILRQTPRTARTSAAQRVIEKSRPGGEYAVHPPIASPPTEPPVKSPVRLISPKPPPAKSPVRLIFLLVVAGFVGLGFIMKISKSS